MTEPKIIQNLENSLKECSKIYNIKILNKIDDERKANLEKLEYKENELNRQIKENLYQAGKLDSLSNNSTIQYIK